MVFKTEFCFLKIYNLHQRQINKRRIGKEKKNGRDDFNGRILPEINRRIFFK